MIESYIESKYSEEIDGLDIYEDGKSIILSRIIISPEYRGLGVGSKIMQDLIDYADNNRKIIALTPSSDYGGNKNKLVQFYKKFGFKHNKGYHKSFEYRDAMIRYPKQIHSMDTINEIRNIVKEILNEIDWSDTFSDVKQVCVPPKDIVDYLNRVIANAPKPTKEREKFDTKYPFVHSKSEFFDKGMSEVNIDEFIARITEEPNTIINKGSKVSKSGSINEYVYKTGVPALRGIVYDIENKKFHFINTCPGAGSCVAICYARKGNYIRYSESYDLMTRRLNLLLNNPSRYEEKMYNEIKSLAEEHKAFSGYKSKVIIRWNDSGDFFSRKYVDIVENVMSRLKDEGYNVDSYAYTKVSDVASDSEFQTTFSSGGNKRESGRVDVSKYKNSVIIPRGIFKDLDLMKIDDEKALKERISDNFGVDKNLILTYDEMLYTPKEDYPKWYVIVTPNDGDDAAFRKDVKTIFLTEH